MLINQTILDAGEKAIPNKIITIRTNSHPWISCNIRRLIRKRKRAYRKYKQTSNVHYWQKYKQLRNICIREIRDSKTTILINLNNN